MKFSLPALGLCLGLMMGYGTATQAADLINEDDMAYTLMIDGTTEVTVEAGENVMAICDSCEIQIMDSDENPVKVMEDSTVVISEGKLITE